jgi:DNA-binding transcriptional regulator YhcF (GntR family)
MYAYRRIIDDLTRRIESGALKPRDRIPSTRALARKWKVANATVARALGELARSGHVKTMPRSGNVVAYNLTPAGRELSPERIVAAAMHIADAAGLEALSVRAVAAQLDAPVMSLYRHVHSKDELVMLMANAALGEVVLPDAPLNGWRAQLELGSRLEWAAMRRHPWLAPVLHISRPSPMSPALAFVDWMMRALDSTTLDEARKLQVHVVLHSFIQGLAVNVDAEAKAVAASGISEADYMREQDETFRRIAEGGQFPYFAKMTRGLPSTFRVDLDALFEMGLGVMLDGLAGMIERHPPAKRGRRRERASPCSA